MIRIFEDANLKLSSVFSNIRGKTCTAVIDAVIAGETDPVELSEMCTHWRLKSTREEIAHAVEGCFTEHHKFMILRAICTSITNIEAEIDHLDKEIECRMHPVEDRIEQLCEIPGMYTKSIRELLAEIGVDMEVFPTAEHLASWAGLAPGNNESAGKKKFTYQPRQQGDESHNDRMCVVCDTNQEHLFPGPIQETRRKTGKETRISRDCRRDAKGGLPHAQRRHGIYGIR